MAFWTLIVILTRSKRMPTHSGRRRRSSELRFGLRQICFLGRHTTAFRDVGASVFGMKTFEPGSKSIICLGRAKQAVEKHMSDLLAVSERNVDMETFYPAECWS